MWPLVLLLLSIVLIIILTNKLKLHPFLSLLIAAFFYGGLNGSMTFNEVVDSINNGFGKTLGYIGIVILFGSIIGKFLENSGGALKLADFAYKILGKNKVEWANGFLGYIISIPVFCDAAFIILSPLSKSLAKRAGVSVVACAISLSLGLYVTHSLVPPTPGPVAAAGILNADLGRVIMFALVISIIGLIIGILFAKYAGRNVQIDELVEEVVEKPLKKEHIPSLFKSLVPIVIPILLIIIRSISQYPTRPFGENGVTIFIEFIGQPVVALFIGVLLSFSLPHKFNKEMLSGSGWIGEAILSAAGIIVITGAGGSFGQVLKDSGIGNVIQENLGGIEGLGIFLPFIIAASLKSAQGSSTVAIITTAGIIAPLLPLLGLDSENSKALAVVAIGAGSMVASHTNDSYFWVVTQLTGLNIQQGLKLQTLGSLLVGSVSIIFIWLLSLFL